MDSSPSPGCAHDQRPGAEPGPGTFSPVRGRNAGPGGSLAVSPRVPGEAGGRQRNCLSPTSGRLLQTLQRLQAGGRQSHGSRPGRQGQRRGRRLSAHRAEPESPGRAGTRPGCRGLQAIHPILEPGQLPVRDYNRGIGQRPRHHQRDRSRGDAGLANDGIHGNTGAAQ